MTDTRIPPLTDDKLEGKALDVLAPMIEAGRAFNIFRTMAHHPDLARRWLVFGNHVLSKSALPPRERELAILRVGWLCQSEYEWAQHKIVARECGITDREIEQIKLGPTPEWSELDQLVLTATDELHQDRMITDETWAGLAAHWNREQLMDLVFAVGQYTLVCMALRTFGVPLDDFLDGF